MRRLAWVRRKELLSVSRLFGSRLESSSFVEAERHGSESTDSKWVTNASGAEKNGE